MAVFSILINSSLHEINNYILCHTLKYNFKSVTSYSNQNLSFPYCAIWTHHVRHILHCGFVKIKANELTYFAYRTRISASTSGAGKLYLSTPCKTGRVRWRHACDDLESRQNEIISTVLKNTSYLFNFDVFDDDM